MQGAEVAFHVAGKRVFPLGLRAVFVGAGDPERSEFGEQVGGVLFREHGRGQALAKQDSREGVDARLPVSSHGESVSSVEVVRA